MSEHFTLRLDPSTRERLDRRARAQGAKPRTLATRYIDEGIRTDEHPMIYFADGPSGRRAAVRGTRLDVWEIIATARHNDNDIAETAAYLELDVSAVETAVTYYGAYRDEIDEAIALNDAESERGLAAWRAGRQALSG